jgi:DNA-binding MarR family transcriptional regulator
MVDTQIPQSSPNDPSDDFDLEVVGRIGRAWREIRRGATASTVRDAIYGIGGSAIEPGQMDALDLLVTVESCRMGDLADHLRVDPSTATRAVQRLVKDDLAQRVEFEGDGRVVSIAATERGRRIHGEVAARRRAIILEVMSKFSPEERNQLANMFERFTAAVDAAATAKLRHRR